MSVSPRVLVGFVIVLGTAACGSSGAAPPGAAMILSQPDAMEIYRIEDPAGGPAANRPHFQGYPVIAQSDVKDPTARERIWKILDGGVRKGGDIKKCFSPHHAIHARRGDKTVDVVICFECSQAEFIAEQKTTVAIASVGAELDQAFDAAGAPLPK